MATQSSDMTPATLHCVSRIHGALVVFGPGAEVLHVTFPGDVTAVRLSHLPTGMTAADLQADLHQLGFAVHHGGIQLWPGRGDAIVRKEDPLFARRLIQALAVNNTLVSRFCGVRAEPALDAMIHGGGGGGGAESSASSSLPPLPPQLPPPLCQYPGGLGDFRSVVCTVAAPASQVQVDGVVAEMRAALQAAVGPILWQCGPFSEAAGGGGKHNEGQLAMRFCFTNANDAMRAVQLWADEGDRTKGDGPPLASMKVRPLFVATFQVPGRVFAARQPQLLAMQQQKQAEWDALGVELARYTATTAPQPPHLPTQLLQLTASVLADLLAARQKVEEVLLGTDRADKADVNASADADANADRPAWHPFFSFKTGNGTQTQTLASVLAKFGVTVVPDSQGEQLHLYGGSVEHREQAASLLAEAVPSEAAEEASEEAAEEEAVEMSSDAASTSVCQVCATPAEDPVWPGCGHVYCRVCFRHFGLHGQTVKAGRALVRCHGWHIVTGADANGAATTSRACRSRVGLDVLMAALSVADFCRVLAAAFNVHVRSHPRQFRFCSTPDCRQVYRVTAAEPGVAASSSSSAPMTVAGTEAPLFACPRCLRTVCTRCHVGHAGLDCAAFQEQEQKLGQEQGQGQGQEEQPAPSTAAHRAMRQRLGLKTCPRCLTDIEKSGGCDHVTCRVCATHICWLCRAGFTDSRACLEHIGEHAMIGEEGEGEGREEVEQEDFWDSGEVSGDDALADSLTDRLRYMLRDEDQLEAFENLISGRIRDVQARLMDEHSDRDDQDSVTDQWSDFDSDSEFEADAESEVD